MFLNKVIKSLTFWVEIKDFVLLSDLYKKRKKKKIFFQLVAYATGN